MPKKKTIGIFAPSAALKEGEDSFVLEGVSLLKANGYDVKFARNLESRYELFAGADYFLAGSHDERLNAFHEIYQDPEVDILLALRGGYGSIYLLPEINYAMIAANPKPICGYSDLTAMFCGIIKKAQIQCFHTPMLVELSRLDAPSRDSFFNILAIADELNLEKQNRKILGGNLTLLTSLVGTEYLPDFTGATLLLEDCNEEPYKVDRMLNQLLLAGVFDKLAEIWVGEPLGTKFNLELLSKISKDKNINLVTDLKLGHCLTKLSIALG